jgi:hypothetical protein
MTPQILFGLGFVACGIGTVAFGLNLIFGWGW